MIFQELFTKLKYKALFPFLFAIAFFPGILNGEKLKTATDLLNTICKKGIGEASSQNHTEALDPTIPFNQNISLINTRGTGKINLEYTGARQYYKVIVLYSSSNKPSLDINILHNGQRIDPWETSGDMGNTLRPGRRAIESYVELATGSILSLLGSNTQPGQSGSDYIRLVKTSASEVPNWITVEDNKGGKAHDDIRVIYNKKQNIIAAKKAFTPNGDGIDDTWHIENADELRGCQLIIMDRAGHKIYEADASQNEWDASFNGSPLPSADYYYIIRCENGHTEAGGIRVIR